MKDREGETEDMKDLTQGKPETVLWQFSIPMFISVIFQQLYNIADSMIAGRFAGEEALAAVGASYPITMIFMAIAVGSNIGCSVVISQIFGAKEYKQLKTAISTSVIASLVIAVVLTLMGISGSRFLMRLIDTPSNIFEQGDLYLRIYIGGFIFLFLYNIVTGIFNALGDSKTPLYFLAGSSIGNIFLDWLLVAVYDYGVAGVAWATFIAQAISCLLATIALKRRISRIKVEGKASLFSLSMLKRISLIAVPSIIQQSFVSVGNICIQFLINGYGSSVIAGYSAAVKMNTFTVMSLTTLANGLSSFIAQNIGARKGDRVKRGYWAGVKMALIVAVPFMLCYFFRGESIIKLFIDDTGREAIQTGMNFLRIISPFYLVIAVKLMIDGVLRGSSNMSAFMIGTFSDLISRVILSFILSPLLGVTGIWIAWAIGWTIGAVVAGILCFRGNKLEEILIQG